MSGDKTDLVTVEHNKLLLFVAGDLYLLTHCNYADQTGYSPLIVWECQSTPVCAAFCDLAHKSNSLYCTTQLCSLCDGWEKETVKAVTSRKSKISGVLSFTDIISSSMNNVASAALPVLGTTYT